MTPSFEIDFPIRCVVGGEPIPDLSKIDRARWREALTPLSHGARVRAARMRLSQRQFAEIERAAALLGLKPTQLARQFILTGAGRVLYEDRRRAQARRRT
jgi:AraC-like DNA-binding protein